MAEVCRFGPWFKEKRIEAGFSVGDVATHCGIEERNLLRIEAGGELNSYLARKLAEALGLDESAAAGRRIAHRMGTAKSPQQIVEEALFPETIQVIADAIAREGPEAVEAKIKTALSQQPPPKPRSRLSRLPR